MYIGEIAALATAALWSVTSIFFSEASVKVSSIIVNITRLILAAIFLLATVIIFDIPINISNSQIIMLVISGAIGFVFGDSFLFKAFQHIGARLSMLIMSISPAMSAVLAYYFLGEILSAWSIVGVLVTIGGIAMVVLYREEKPSSDYKKSNIGIFYGFLGALGQAVGLIFAKYAFIQSDINGFWAALIRVSAAIFFMFPLFFLIKRIRNPIKIFRAEKKALKYTALGSFTGPYLGVTLSLISITYAKVGIAATLMGTVPIIMLPIVRYFYKEKLGLVSVLGAILAVCGIAILFLKS
ncbi:MAG: DMT family transporter [Ignavibacteria bacterium]|nr:DMT family transporter [Ignavibacteria bacterium]